MSNCSFFHSVFYLFEDLASILTKFNSLIYDRFLDWSKLKAFADDKIYLKGKLKLVLGTIESNFGKGENVSYQHFCLFPNCFQNPPFSGSLKVRIVW